MFLMGPLAPLISQNSHFSKIFHIFYNGALAWAVDDILLQQEFEFFGGYSKSVFVFFPKIY